MPEKFCWIFFILLGRIQSNIFKLGSETIRIMNNRDALHYSRKQWIVNYELIHMNSKAETFLLNPGHSRNDYQNLEF